MNEFEKGLLRYFDEDALRRIRRVKVGIAGAGGLGSNCAACLVRSGFNRLRIIDFDKVESSNLNRQFFFIDQIGLLKVEALRTNLLRVNPALEIEAEAVYLRSPGLEEAFSDCDAVVEAVDTFGLKRDLAEAYADSGKFYVSASGLAGWGNSDAIVTRRIKATFHLVGDLATESSQATPPCAPRVCVTAAKQADLILAWALGSTSTGIVTDSGD